MAKFPQPPPRNALTGYPPDEALLAQGTLLWRIYHRGGPHPTAWNTFRRYGPTASRFDHHAPPPRVQDRGVLYTVANVATCIAEFFQETRTIDPGRRQPWLAAFRITRAVRLLSLRGNWPTQAGASMNINSGSRERARHWSIAIYEAFPAIQGLLYCSSMDANERAVVLYERAEDGMPARPEMNKPLAAPDLAMVLEQAADRFGYGLVVP